MLKKQGFNGIIDTHPTTNHNFLKIDQNNSSCEEEMKQPIFQKTINNINNHSKVKKSSLMLT